MIIGIILAFFYVRILKIIEEPYIKIVESNGGNVYASIPARKKLSHIRNVSFGIYVILLTIQFIVMQVVNSNTLDEINKNLNSLTGVFMGTMIVLIRNRKYSHYGKVSFSTIEDVRACKKPYVLYLRAFEEDDYSYSKTRSREFSEYGFISCFPKSVQTFSVGMTKEVFCPRGSKRIYCSDSLIFIFGVLSFFMSGISFK